MGAIAADLDSENAPLSRAIAAAGGREKLAEAIGVSGPYVSQWRSGVRNLTPEHCPAIERHTEVRCEELRPDLVWVRDGAGEVLGYVTPVDGADAAYVRQALVVEPDEKRTDTVLDSDLLTIKGRDGGDVLLTIDLGVRAVSVHLDPFEAAEAAASILDERDRVMPTIPEGMHEELDDFPNALLPLRVHLEDNGLHMDVAITDQTTLAKVVRQDRNPKCILSIAGVDLLLDRQEADALAYALTNGNDGSRLANASRLACASMSEAIAVLRNGETDAMKREGVANELAHHVNLLLDLDFSYREHQLRRHGNLRYGYPPSGEAADALSEAAREAVSTMATVRGALSRGEYVNAPGFEDRGEPRRRGFYQDMRNAERSLQKAIQGVMLQVNRSSPANEAPRNPLEATAVSPKDEGDECYMTNIRWRMNPDATVGECLEEASLMLGSACKLILNNSYDESEDTMSLMLGIAKASVSAAHSKLLRFGKEGAQA